MERVSGEVPVEVKGASISRVNWMKTGRGCGQVEGRECPLILYDFYDSAVRPTVPKWQPEGGGHDNQSTIKKKGRINESILERCVPARNYAVHLDQSRHCSLCSPTLVPKSCDDSISPFHTLMLPLNPLACMTTLLSMTLWMHHKPWSLIACSNCGCTSYHRCMKFSHTYNVTLNHSKKGVAWFLYTCCAGRSYRY